MKLKGLLLTAAVAASANVMATDYYVKPGNAATGNDGSSWDKALTIWDIYQNEAVAKKKEADSKYKNGDVFFFAGGTYYPTLEAGGVAQRIYRGYIFVGGCDPTQGPVTTWPTYPSATPTIFSGDLNADGVASPGDARCLVNMRLGSKGMNTADDRYTVSDASLKPLTFHGFEFKCAYNESEWPSSEAADAMTGWGALSVVQGWLELYNCDVHDTYAAKASGMSVYGSLYNLRDCRFYNNHAVQTGAALRVNINTDIRYSRGTVERCAFYNNTLDDRYGAAIALTAGEMYIVNSTVSGNTAYAEGGGVVANGDKNATRKLHIINSTIAGNTCTADPTELYKTDAETGEVTNPGSLVGTDLRIAADANFNMYNSIVVGRTDDGTVAYAPIVMKDAAKGEAAPLFEPRCEFENFNITGSCLPLIEAEKWSYIKKGTTNSMQAANTFAALFGEQDINASADKVLVPNKTYIEGLAAQEFYPPYVADVNTYAAQLATEPLFVTTGYQVPDLTVDQTGAKRNANDDADYCPGAFDAFANTTGIAGVQAQKPAAQKYMYNLQGQRVNDAYRGIVIVNGKKVVK